MENEDKKPKEVDTVSNTDIYAEYDYIGGMIMAERPKKKDNTDNSETTK
jgi:hypothetical protein